MKTTKTFSVIGGAVLALAISGSAFAAENASGVAEHLGLTLTKIKDAQAAAAASNKDQCLVDIKQAKQHYKEITGDAAGKPLQDAIKTLKVGQEQCEKGDTATAATTLSGVVDAVAKIQAAASK